MKMDFALISKLVSQRFPNVTKVRDLVLRADRRYNGKPLGIYYFDCSKSLLEPDFDLKDYQDELLARDYYRHEGALQWSFYLYFICDSDEYALLRESGLLTVIESDKIYARKFVLTEGELEQDLRTASKPSIPTYRSTEDLSGRWIKRLRNADLDGVFMPRIAQTQVVEQYLDGEPVKEDIAEADTAGSSEVTTVNTIDRVKIERYHLEHIRQEYEFGRFNLIEGDNGSGKTSMLEAIELWMCGKTFRNPDERGSESRIGIQLNGEERYEWNEGKGNDFYRRRDFLWYGNYYPQGNRLHLSFNRFNFFDSDAGARLALVGRSDLSEELQIQSALAGLIVGETANMIEARLNAVVDIFKRKSSALQREIDAVKGEIAEVDRNIKELSTETEQEQVLRDRFATELRNLGWLESVSRDEAWLGSFGEKISQSIAEMRICRSGLSWLPSLSLEGLRSENQILESTLSKISDLDHEIRGLRASLSERNKDLDFVLKRCEFISEMEMYVFQKDADQLAGLSDSIGSAENRRDLFLTVLRSLEGVDLNSYADVTDSISGYIEELASGTRRCEQQRRAVEQERDEYLRHHEMMAKLVAEIRSLGSAVLSMEPDTSHCPLCGATYQKGELAKKLQRYKADAKDSRVLEGFRRRSEATENEIRVLQARHAGLNGIRSAVSMISDTGHPDEIPVADAVKMLSGVQRQLGVISDELTNLEALRARLGSKGLTEERYLKLRHWFAQAYPEVSLAFADREKYTQFRCESQQEMELQRSLTDNVRAELDDRIVARESAAATYLGRSIGELEAEEELLRRSKEVRNALEKVGQLKALIRIDEHENLSDIEARLVRAESRLGRFQQSMKSLEESSRIRRTYEARLQQARARRGGLIQKMTKSDSAISVIEDILLNDSKEKCVERFLAQNLMEVVEVFRVMHFPREFSEIRFASHRADRLCLVQCESQTERSLSQISSGQRNALALSIFLVLNRRLPQGPFLIMLDDPVAHVDDLNILLFLDYLRDLLLEGQRQIFFATADQKTASLCARKFDFLSDDFKRVRLTRANM